MQTHSSTLLSKASMLAVLAALVGGCRKAPPTTTTPEAPALAVRVLNLQPSSIAHRIELTGTVHAAARAVLSSKVPGRLDHLGLARDDASWQPIAEGERVSAGDVVASVDRDVYALLEQQARAALEMADAQREDAVRDATRMHELHREGSATEQMRDRAETARRVAEAQRDQAAAALAMARIDLEESRPRVPWDGVVTQVHLDAGNRVAPGQPLLTIEALDRVKLRFDVPERHLAALHAGRTPVRLRGVVANEPGWEGVLTRVHPTVDPATRTAVIEVVADNPRGLFRPGGFVRAEVELERREGVVAIPGGAILWQGSDAFVFVLQDGRARRRELRIGLREGDRFEVLEGLSPGDALILDGLRLLRDGDPAEVREGGRP